MATVLTDNRYYSEIAEAIREKNGGSDLYTPSQMAEAIKNIQAGEAMSIETIWAICGYVPNGGLPDGYTLLEYIQSSGTQYINTEFNPNQDTRVVMDAQILNEPGTKTAIYFGVRGGGGFFEIYKAGSGANLTFLWNATHSKYFTVSYTLRRTVEVNKNTATVDGTTLTYTYASFQSTLPLFLGADNATGTATAITALRIYSCQIYDNDVLVRDFVPCINPSGVYGLYDKVNAQFYANAGSGSFTGA